MRGVLVLGAGGHGKVVADILLSQGTPVLGFLDDDPATWGGTRLGLPVLGALDRYADHDHGGLALGIGSNSARLRVVERLGSAAEALWLNAVHPRATLAASARLGRGLVIAAGAIVNPDSVLGDYVIINTGAGVDHDCIVREYAHLAPGVHLSGGVGVGIGVLIGVGAAVAPACSIGGWAVVGAGAAVVRDVPGHVIARGVPARW